MPHNCRCNFLRTVASNSVVSRHLLCSISIMLPYFVTSLQRRSSFRMRHTCTTLGSEWTSSKCIIMPVDSWGLVFFVAARAHKDILLTILFVCETGWNTWRRGQSVPFCRPGLFARLLSYRELFLFRQSATVTPRRALRRLSALIGKRHAPLVFYIIIFHFFFMFKL